MSVRIRRLLEDDSRLIGKEQLVALVVHKPPKLRRKGANRGKIASHPVDKGVSRNAGVAGQRGVADEIGSLQALLHRRAPGKTRHGIHRDDQSQSKPPQHGKVLGVLDELEV